MTPLYCLVAETVLSFGTIFAPWITTEKIAYCLVPIARVKVHAT